MCDEARCVECGRVTERSLPLRFPHICHDCLFPELEGQQFPGRALSWREMLEHLHRSASANHWRTPRTGRE